MDIETTVNVGKKCTIKGMVTTAY